MQIISPTKNYCDSPVGWMWEGAEIANWHLGYMPSVDKGGMRGGNTCKF